MPRVTKKIVSEGVYRLADGRLVPIDANRINHWASEFNRYRRAGNLLPGPWSHIDPTTKQPVVMGPHLERSDINAGFWENLRVETDPQFGVTLIGDIEVPGDLNDPNTPAGKIGKTVRETSIYVAPEFTDGAGNRYTDVPLHIALVTHPIQPGQSNFQPAIAMSQLAFTMAAVPPSASGDASSSYGGNSDKPSDDAGKKTQQQDGKPAGAVPPNASSPDIGSVLQALQACGIVLPKDTNDTNFLERLMVALGQKAASETDDDSLYQPPEGAETKQPAPVAMSSTPITAENFASISKDVFMSHPVAKELHETNQMLLGVLLTEAKKARKARIDALLAARPDLKEFADASLYPLVESFQMSFGPNAPKPSLDVMLDTLEAIPAPKPAADHRRAALLQNSGAGALAMAHDNDNPFIMGVGADYDADKVVDKFFSNTGGNTAQA